MNHITNHLGLTYIEQLQNIHFSQNYMESFTKVDSLAEAKSKSQVSKELNLEYSIFLNTQKFGKHLLLKMYFIFLNSLKSIVAKSGE